MPPGAMLMTCALTNRVFLRTTLALAALLLPDLSRPDVARAADSSPRLTFKQIEQIVAEQMDRKRDYRPGDLISRADVEPIFNRLLELGVEPADRETLYDAFLPHNSFLVSELSTAAGMKFMRKVSKFPNVYDRLERLSWMPAGRELIRELTHRADGPEVLQSLTTLQGAEAVEKIMAGDIRGANFALPTGHIHTAEQLLERLKGTHGVGSDQKPASRGET